MVHLLFESTDLSEYTSRLSSLKGNAKPLYPFGFTVRALVLIHAQDTVWPTKHLVRLMLNFAQFSVSFFVVPIASIQVFINLCDVGECIFMPYYPHTATKEQKERNIIRNIYFYVFYWSLDASDAELGKQELDNN